MADDTPEERAFLGMTDSAWAALSSLSAVCAFVTLIVGVFQYTTSLEADRAKQTLEMVEEWRDEGYRDHFLHLADLAGAQMGQMTDADLAFLQENPAAQRKAAAGVAKAVLDQGAEATEALDEVVYFFNLLGLCVEARLCSEQTAAGFFDSTLVNFHNIFESQITSRQKARPDYASGMIFLIKRIGT